MEKAPVNPDELPGQYNPENLLLEKELLSDLGQLMLNIPEKHRKVIYMKYVDEMSLRQIGLIMGVTGERIRQIISKSLMALKSNKVPAKRGFGQAREYYRKIKAGMPE